MDKIKAFLIWSRIVDKYDNGLSLTNLALIISLFTLNPLLIAITLLGYSFKKFLNKDKNTSGIEDLKTKIAELDSTVTRVSIQVGLKK